MASSEYSQVRTTDYFFGNLTPENHWTQEPLDTLLRNLPDGTSEIMCHPGLVDGDLRAITSFLSGREVERRLFSNPDLRTLLAKHSVELATYRVLS
jgi:hypothetical protein